MHTTTTPTNNDLNYTLDLHGYTLDEAMEVVDDKVREAWTNGYKFITLIHGSPFIRSHMQAKHQGRGRIKWELRGRLARGSWGKYMFYRRSKKHDLRDGSMVLALKPNPNANEPEVWSEISDGYYMYPSDVVARQEAKEEKSVSRTNNVYHGRNAADTRKLQSDLRKTGPRGRIAAEVFRAARASSMANKRSGGGVQRSKGGFDSFSDLDYEKKTEALKKLCELLDVDASGIKWGWLEDEEEAIAAPFLLFVVLRAF
jgi:hypothetical protein